MIHDSPNGQTQYSMLDELKATAENCVAFCKKCGYIGKDEPSHRQHRDCDYQAARVLNVHRGTILKLIAVVEAAKNVCPDTRPDKLLQPNMQRLFDALKELDHA